MNQETIETEFLPPSSVKRTEPDTHFKDQFGPKITSPNQLLFFPKRAIISDKVGWCRNTPRPVGWVQNMQFRNVANAINTGIYLYLPKEVEQHLVICDPFDMPEITLHFDRIKDNGDVQYLFWDSLDDFDHIRDMKFDQYLNCLPDGHEFEDTFVALAKSMLKETSNTQ